MKNVAIISCGQSNFGSFVEKTYEDLFADAYLESLKHIKNFEASDIEEAFIGSLAFGGSQLGNMSALVTDSINVVGIPAARVENACGSSSFAFRYAVHSIMSGQNKIAIAGGVEKMQDISKKSRLWWFGVAGDIKWERLSGMTFPGNYALMATRHMYEFGTKKEDISRCAVKNHKYAAMNPKAQFRNEITIEQVMKAPIVAWPLTVFDCCPLTDGAAITILCDAEIAKKYTDTPVYVIGMGAGTDHLALYRRESLTRIEAAIKASKAAYQMAKVEPKEIQVAEVHDCFTIAEILAYEDCGFCKKGEGGLFSHEGQAEVGGKTPINTGGGLKAKGHPIGATGVSQIYEIWKQLTERHQNQVNGAEIGLTHNVGGTGSAAAIHILKRG
ncbi:MAG TPA: thiolase domain-containing protein [Candidatus Deferrimicrobium sp.]|nr:thiolase domain-containing protein [Candidatus Deferrimicrobium sp.]